MSVDMSNAFNMGKTIHVPTQILNVSLSVSSLVIGFTCLYVFGEKRLTIYFLLCISFHPSLWCHTDIPVIYITTDAGWSYGQLEGLANI